MPIKTPIYRFFAPSSGSVYYYSDELPGDAITPTIIGFSGDSTYTEEVFASAGPDSVSGLTFWLEADQYDAGTWNPTTNAGAAWEWVPDTSALTVTSSGGNTLIDIPASTYAEADAFSSYFTTNSWHVFVVGVRDETTSKSSTSNWLNHRLLGDGAGWWGMYHKYNGGPEQAYGFMYNGGQYTQIDTAAPKGTLYLYEWYKPVGIETATFRVNGEVAVTGGTTTPAVGNMNGPLNVGEDMLGGLGEVLIYSGTLSAEDQATVRSYLISKYNFSF